MEEPRLRVQARGRVSYDTFTSAPHFTSQSSALRSVEPVNTVVMTRSRLPALQ